MTIKATDCMADARDKSDLCAIVRLREQLFGISTDFISEIFAMESTPAATPGAPSFVRGVVVHRGRVLTVVDMRKRLDMGSSQNDVQEFCDLMSAREQDHLRWLTELQSSVRERRPFTLALDPHLCAFGKWFDQFHTDDLDRRSALRQLRGPHVEIHGIGAKVEALKQADRYDEIDALLGQSQQILTRLRESFSDLRGVLRTTTRETAMRFRTPRREFVAVVDSVVSVEKVSSNRAKSNGSGEILPTRFGQIAEGRLVQFLEVGNIFSE